MMRSLRSLDVSTASRVVFWFAVAIIGVVSVQHVVALVLAVIDGNVARIGLDYRVFVAGGELVRSGNSDFLYLPNTPEFQEFGIAAFVYPPWVALFMVPWSLLPMGLGLVAWTVSGVAVMVAGLRSCGVRDWRPLLLSMVSFPALFALGLGQSSFLFVGIVAFAVASMLRQRIARSGIYVALAAWKPHLLGGFGILWLSEPRRWWKQLLWTLATTMVLAFVSGLVLPGSWRAWFSMLVGRVNNDASAVLEASLMSMVSFLTVSSSIVRWAIVGVAAVALIALCVVVIRRGMATLEVVLALVFGTWLLIAPHVLVYDVLILLVPMSLAFQTRLRRDVVVSGTLLVLGLSIGPLVNELQLDAWGRALNLSTVSLLFATSMFMYWGWTGGPFFVGGASIGAGSSSAGCDDTEAP